ncbi:MULTISPECIES: bacteriocin immunity protein [unclassified Pseudomonas]|jgi:hypothetical protein|uniref:bacteriocin immunity protein n=1 Tax=Pseudomonas sp. A-R-26 TaxID=2832404 RepID=UPI001CBC8518|nr:bacteriocin immunity protein [Pseudomonas sp. A-R-26]
MELKATLKDFTAAEFQALVSRIWAVDLPKQDHDRLINHFDQIVGHPSGADLLFYPVDNGWDGPESVIHHVRGWHQKHTNSAAFKDEAIPMAPPPASASAAYRHLAEVHKITADVAVSQQLVEMALGTFAQAIQYARTQQSVDLEVSLQEESIRALERAQHETHKAVRNLESWKMRLEFARNSAKNNLAFARSEHALWQSNALQINATHDRHVALLADFVQRHRGLHDEAEAVLIAAQGRLIQSRTLAGVGPTQTARVVNASLAFANSRPAVLLEGAPSELEVGQLASLQKAIRSVVGELTWRKTSIEPADKSLCAAILNFEFSSRADAQVYGLSIPLIELLPIEGLDWQSLAAKGAEVNVPFRLGTAIVPVEPGTKFKWLREIKTLSQIHITESLRSHTGVRVRSAHFNEQSGAFSFYR